MISGKILVCLVLLTTANYMLAQTNQPDESPNGSGPNTNGPGSNGPGPNGPGQNGPEDQSGSEEDGGPQSRFFFSSFFNTRLISCNYTTQAGASCANCRQVLRCFSGDVGTLRTCTGFFPYCNNGRCSLFQQNNCTAYG